MSDEITPSGKRYLLIDKDNTLEKNKTGVTIIAVQFTFSVWDNVEI